MRLYLITHANTQQDPKTGSRSWRLSIQGHAQAEALARLPMWQDVDRIVLSSEPKTRLTVAPLLERNKFPTIVDERFDELFRQGWVGDYAMRVCSAFARPDDGVGGWEAANVARDRFVDGVRALHSAHSDECLALVSHGLVLSLYRARLLGQPMVDYADWQKLAFGAVALANPAESLLLRDFEPVLGSMPRA